MGMGQETSSSPLPQGGFRHQGEPYRYIVTEPSNVVGVGHLRVPPHFLILYSELVMNFTQQLSIWPSCTAYQNVYLDEEMNPTGSVEDVDVINGDMEVICIDHPETYHEVVVKSYTPPIALSLEDPIKTSWGETGELIIPLPVGFTRVQLIPRHHVLTPKTNADE